WLSSESVGRRRSELNAWRGWWEEWDADQQDCSGSAGSESPTQTSTTARQFRQVTANFSKEMLATIHATKKSWLSCQILLIRVPFFLLTSSTRGLSRFSRPGSQ